MAISCRAHCICPPGTKRHCTDRRDIPGSTAFVPSVAGLILAGEVVNSAAMDGAYQPVGRHSGMTNCTSCLSLWERWPSESETGEGKQGWKALSVTFGDSSPSGRAKGCTYFGLRNGVYRYRYAPFTVLRLSIKERRRTVPFPERVAALYDLGWTLLLTLLPAPNRCFSAPLQPRRQGAGWIPPCRPSAAGFSPSGRCGIWNVPSLPPTGRTPEQSRSPDLPSPWGESDPPWPLQCPARRGRDSPRKTAGRAGRHMSMGDVTKARSARPFFSSSMAAGVEPLNSLMWTPG